MCRCPTCTAQPVCTAPGPLHWDTYGPLSTATAMERALHRSWAPHMSLWRKTLKTKMQMTRPAWSVCAHVFMVAFPSADRSVVNDVELRAEDVTCNFYPFKCIKMTRPMLHILLCAYVIPNVSINVQTKRNL